MLKRYRVTGDFKVFGHAKGRTFEHDFGSDAAERIHLDAGTLAIVGEPNAAKRSAPKRPGGRKPRQGGKR